MLKSFIKDIVSSFLGCVVSAFGTACFLLPNKLSSGGFAGIATILYYFLNLPMGTTIIFLNIPVFIIAYFKLGKKFLFKSIISTIAFSFFLDTFDEINIFLQDKFLASIYGGILIGIGQALIFRGKSSTGGSDLIANIVNELKPRMKLGNALVLLDSIIVGLNLIFFKNIEIGLYSGIAIYIVGKMIDLIFEGINFSKVLYIISEKSKDVAFALNTELERGATGLYGKGVYSGVNKLIIMCVTKRSNVGKVKELAKRIDKNAFIIISDVREVYGEGFK